MENNNSDYDGINPQKATAALICALIAVIFFILTLIGLLLPNFWCAVIGFPVCAIAWCLCVIFALSAPGESCHRTTL